MGSRGPLPATQQSLSSLPANRQVPEHPHGLLKATVGAWEAYWSSPVAGVIDLSSDISVVTRWIHYLDEWHRTMRIIKREGFTVFGSQEQPVLSPAANYLSKIESILARLENELGLTPLARAKLGLANVEGKMALHDLNRMAGDAGQDIAGQDALEVEGVEKEAGWTTA